MNHEKRVDVMLGSNKVSPSPRRKLMAQGATHKCSNLSAVRLDYPVAPFLCLHCGRISNPRFDIKH